MDEAESERRDASVTVSDRDTLRSRRVMASLCCIVLSALLLLYFGNWRGRDRSFWDHDLKFWYLGGKLWLAGESPYNHELFAATWEERFGPMAIRERAFVYPPVISVICLPIGLLPWESARLLWRAVLIAAFYGIFYLILRLVRAPPVKTHHELPLGCYFAAAALLFSLHQTMDQGQLALVVLAGAVMAFHAWRTERATWFVAGFALACIKPQLSLLPLLYLGLRAPKRWVAAGMLIAGVPCVVVPVLYGTVARAEIRQESMGPHCALCHSPGPTAV